MPTEKNSFIVYNDQAETFKELSDTDAGKLIKAMIDYSCTGSVPELPPILKMAFIPIRQQMDRNIKKYDNICERNKKNIEKRWGTKDTSGISGIPKDTKNTDTDKDTDTDTDNKKENRERHSLNLIKKKVSIYEITPEIITAIAGKYLVPESFVTSKYDDMVNWHESSGKQKKDWIATLRNWVKRDAIKLKQESYGKSSIAFYRTE